MVATEKDYDEDSTFFSTVQRAGEGVRPVPVEDYGISLLSCVCERFFPVVHDGIPPLQGDI